MEQLLFGKISPTDFLQILHEYGFVYFYNLDTAPLNISVEDFQKLELYANRFFTLPLNKKMRYYIGSSPNHRGYVPVSEKGAYGDEKSRVYEAFDMSYTTYFKDEYSYQKLMGENIWPEEDIKGFKEVVEGYYKQMFLLGKSILSILAQSFDLSSDYFEEYTKYPPAQLRLINYLDNDLLKVKDKIKMGAHTDYECFTFIYQSSPGIQGYIQQNKKF
ncbi:MAG TPA: 2-oxoglutarate and iron-dependent oxygenase domain-containing protein, partial [Aquella sp.]|nr:2-oxoglutarate and iron-dependent oxygenase domain-containing protein [Aquella sp.]